MSEQPEALFDEFVAKFARGDEPNVLEYLDRAGDESAELAGVLEIFLTASTPPEPSHSTVRLFMALEESSHTAGREAPLSIVREQLGLTRESVLQQLQDRFKVKPSKRRKLARYFDELEAGLLEPARLDRKLVVFLEGLFDVDIKQFAALTRPSRAVVYGSRPLPPRRAVRRSKTTSTEPESPHWDDVDELFRGGRR